MELIDVLNNARAVTPDGWQTVTEIIRAQGLDEFLEANRNRVRKQLKMKLREGLVEQQMVLRPKELGGQMTPMPGFRVKASHG